MNRAVSLAGVLLLVVVAAPVAIAQNADRWLPDPSATYRVSRFIDGDTLDIWNGRRDVRVRMLRINSPERGHPAYEGASRNLRRLVGNAQVRLELEGDTHDRNGRLLAYVFVERRNINLEMVETGWAGFFRRYGEGKYGARFDAAERKAKATGEGVWRYWR